MLTRSAIALVSVILMLALAAWESSITNYPAAFDQLWNGIKQIDYPDKAISALAAPITALATVVLAYFSYTLWRVNDRQSSDARVIQRAYVKISHSSPGVEVDKSGSGNFWHQACVKNFGQTPARVTDVVMKPVVVAHNEPLPAIPDYTCVDPGPSLKAFLVREDEFFIPRHHSIPQYQMSRVMGGSADLYMIGFVDYKDQFDVRHRGGYVRQYYPAIDQRKNYETDEAYTKRNNLFVVSQDGYNYDRLRRRGEGKDWDDNGA